MCCGKDVVEEINEAAMGPGAPPCGSSNSPQAAVMMTPSTRSGQRCQDNMDAGFPLALEQKGRGLSL